PPTSYISPFSGGGTRANVKTCQQQKGDISNESKMGTFLMSLDKEKQRLDITTLRCYAVVRNGGTE
ncbi:MAG: hypothetical protein WC440_05495, partial [Candidatus Omnitrophota bacterium]